MIRVGAGIVICRVATRAGIGRGGVIPVVTGITIAGNRNMCPGKWVNRVVVESSGRPCRLAVTIGAGGRELCSGVVRIGRSRKICRVAAIAGVRRIVVVAVVAGRTVAGNRGVRTLQHIIVVVNRECSRIPTRIGGVASGTIGRQTQRAVIGVGAGIVICCVTTCAGIGRGGVIAVVAGVAIICNRNVRTRKRIHRIVVERRRCPGGLAVAGRAGSREMRGCVVRIGGSRIIGRMTAVAGVRRIGVVAVVAGRTVAGNTGMRAIQWIE